MIHIDMFKRPWLFTGVFLLVFLISATLLYLIDFVPETKQAEENAPETELHETLVTETPETPVRIAIKKIGVNTIINNPASVSIEALDQALLSGAVRYPGSAELGENATMFLFGHQSYLPVVRNQAFKAFNGLQNLEEGDLITVYSEENEYQYAVRSVSLVEADDALIPLTAGERNLVLSTCNSFGEPGERYVVEATYIQKIAQR